jgi:uncharacterized repeat protein (TIGR04052 family)
VAITLLAACAPEHTNPEHIKTVPRDDAQTAVYQIEIKPFYNKQALACDLGFSHLGQAWNIVQLAFFISDMHYQLTDEQWQPITFAEGPWQTEHTALIWYASDCNNVGANVGESQKAKVGQTNQSSAQQNTVVVFKDTDFTNMPAQTRLRFSLSVPFEYNHLNPLTQASPLNHPSMFWSWRLGHKFLRLDMSSQQAQHQWSFHLGSLGCQSQSSLRPPEKACTQPNRFDMTLELDSQTALSVLQLNLEALLANIDLANMPPCMFELSEQESCARLLLNLQNQSLFTASKDEALSFNEAARDVEGEY